MKQQTFDTPDLYLIAFLIIFLKIEPEFNVINNKTYASFPLSDDLYRAMDSYNRGAEVSALTYADIIKRIRGELITRRQGR